MCLLEVSDLVCQHEPIGRKDVSNFEEQQQKWLLIHIASLLPPCCARCEVIVSQFLSMDLDNDDVGAFLKDLVLPATNGLV